MDKQLVDELTSYIVNDCQRACLTIGDETYFKADAVTKAIENYFGGVR